MTVRSFAVMTTAILLLTATLAVETSDIDNCCFVDRQCHSDQQWTDGYWAFQNNQCSAPAPSQPTGGAPAQVDNCCYVDRQCHSELDWRAGWHAYQNNQCAAPAPSQPSGGAPAPSQPTGGAPAQVDNCCFVDRQCHSELDWRAGWHAYQNNQCAAPASSQPTGVAPAPSQPTGGAPAQVDNCCYVDRQCHSELDWRAGWHAYQNNQCAAPGQAQTVASPSSASGVLLRTATGIVIGYPGAQTILPSTTPFPFPEPKDYGEIFSYSYNNCCKYHWQCNNDSDWTAGYNALRTNRRCARPGLISIVGDPDFVDFFAGRLEELKNRLPQRYDYVLNGLDKIQHDRHREDNGGDAVTGERSFHVGWQGDSFDGYAKRMSAAIVHEACHIHRHDAGFVVDACQPETYIREETFCREMELQVIIELDSPAHLINWARGMVADTRAETNVFVPSFC